LLTRIPNGQRDPCASPATLRSWKKTDARHRLADGGLADTAFRAMHTFRGANYPSEIRQPILMLAASNDTHRLDGGDRGIRLSPARRFASGDRGLQARDPAGAGRYRAQFWAAFDAFVPGTALFK